MLLASLEALTQAQHKDPGRAGTKNWRFKWIFPHSHLWKISCIFVSLGFMLNRANFSPPGSQTFLIGRWVIALCCAVSPALSEYGCQGWSFSLVQIGPKLHMKWNNQWNVLPNECFSPTPPQHPIKNVSHVTEAKKGGPWFPCESFLPNQLFKITLPLVTQTQDLLTPTPSFPATPSGATFRDLTRKWAHE